MKISKLFPVALTAALLVPSFALSALAQTVTNVLSFDGTDGSSLRFAPPVQGRDGRLYGMAWEGGAFGYGTLWVESPSGDSGSVLYNFDGPTGKNPMGGLLLGTDGNFYGVATSGGNNDYGVLFRLGSDGTYSVIHYFAGGNDGCWPEAGLIEASDGNLYGTTLGCTAGNVYRYTQHNSFSTIFKLTTNEGHYPYAPVMQASDGNLWGTAGGGGAQQCGSIFKISLSGTFLHSVSFQCSSNSRPYAGVIQAADGNLYGTTSGGGLGYGTVFKVTTNGVLSTVYEFQGRGAGYDLASPYGGIMQASDGKLYGTSEIGGHNAQGGIYSIDAGVYSKIYDFDGNPHIDYVFTGLVQHSNGKLYSVSQDGGSHSDGSLFSVDVGLAPGIIMVRTVGQVGQTAQVLGQGLTGSTSVTFNGVPATNFSVVSDTYMTAVVPSGATTGPVVVTTPSGPLTSNVNFRISQ
jgi:uncharacterized repeat protein (TIGR03803 family)